MFMTSKQKSAIGESSSPSSLSLSFSHSPPSHSCSLFSPSLLVSLQWLEDPQAMPHRARFDSILTRIQPAMVPVCVNLATLQTVLVLRSACSPKLLPRLAWLLKLIIRKACSPRRLTRLGRSPRRAGRRDDGSAGRRLLVLLSQPSALASHSAGRAGR